MGTPRARVDDSGMVRKARVGDGFTILNPATYTGPDAAVTLPASAIAGGIISAPISAGRIYTLPPTAELAAQFPDLDIGESVLCLISVNPAFAVTLAGNGGTSLLTSVRTTIPGATMAFIKVTKFAVNPGTGVITWTTEIL